MARILIVDDDEGVGYTLSSLAKREGHETRCVYRLQEGLEVALSDFFDVIFLDVRLPDGNGLDVLPRILKIASPPEVIIITGEGSPEGAELALRSGAWDYLQKPLSVQAVRLALLRVLQYREARAGRRLAHLLEREGIIGDSPPIRRCLDLVGQASQSDTSVLITGETGTGKELFAYAIHKNSPRSHKSFIVVDCAALPETLVESLLFGYEKGAFTGADRAHEGLIKQADGGTLFLDEVGELRLSTQGAFLRVLQEHRYRPVGGKTEVESDFRLITATNRNLDQMVQMGRYRQDLLHRIQSMVIELPPLRDRRKDIRELAMHVMNRYCDRHKKATKGFSPEFLEVLMAYDWPGNVRELENSMNTILTTAGDEPIFYPHHLPIQIRVKVTREAVRKEERVLRLPKDETVTPQQQPLAKYKEYRERALEAVEMRYLKDLMAQTRGNIKEAIQISGLSQSRLYSILKKRGFTGSSYTGPTVIPEVKE
jgi:two-component system, NtrC family, response regulator